MQTELPITEIALFIVGAVFTFIGFLLRQKDEKQEEQIKLLFSKHDEDAAGLEKLRLEIAKHHYIRPELDAKFDKLENSIVDGLDKLGMKFDKLGERLMKDSQ
jgi:hypothetical protein